MIPVVTPEGVGDRGMFGLSYRLMSIGDNEVAFFPSETGITA